MSNKPKTPLRARALLMIPVTLMLVFSIIIQTYACTAIYIGKDASADGTTLIAKSNDYGDVWANYVNLTPRVENAPGRTMPIDNAGTVFTEIPATTYRYTSTPFMDSATAYNHLGSDATVCANEYGVVMIMSITAFSNEKALGSDPLIENGLSEFTAVDLVTCQSATAREAVEVLFSIIDEYGSSEVNIAIIADQTEAWYVEMYNGHQYAAVKLPADAACFFGNEFSLEYLSDYEECIVSEGLESRAVDGGFAVYGENNELNLLATYSGQDVVTNYSHLRTWMGHKLLSPSSYGGFGINDVYPLCFNPENKVSLRDVMELIRNRFEGTEYSPDETGRTDIRVIGTDTALSVHIAQIRHDLPADIGVVTWESAGPALYGVFIPVSNGVTEIAAPYNRNQSTDDFMHFDSENYPYYRIKELNTLVVEPDTYKIYGIPVREYWHEAENKMIDGMETVLSNAVNLKDRNAARSYITDYCNAMQEKAYLDAGVLLNDVKWYLNKNCNTMKNGRNPETHDISDEIKEIAPLSVTADISGYSELPELPEETNAIFPILLVLAAGAVIIAIVAVTTKKRP